MSVFSLLAQHADMAVHNLHVAGAMVSDAALHGKLAVEHASDHLVVLAQADSGPITVDQFKEKLKEVQQEEQLGWLTAIGKYFIGIFQKGGEVFAGFVTGIIPTLVVLMTAFYAVTELVVDLLELVEVDEHERRLFVSILADGDRMLQLLVEESPVRESRQWVEERLLAQLLLELALRGDVEDVALQVQRLAGLVEDDHAFVANRHHPSIPRQQAVLEAGGIAQFAGGVPAMCDGITQGRDGMQLSLFSRDVIAMSTAIALSHDMFDATLMLGAHPTIKVPALGYKGAPLGLDARRVVASNYSPIINTGIAHKEAGIGQIGAGITRAPLECFAQAIAALAARVRT